MPDRLRDRRAARPQNFPAGREAEHHAHRQAFMAHVIKLNAVRRRLNFLQAEGVGRKAVEPRPPIGGQARPALAHCGAIAMAFEAGLWRVEIQQRLEIAPPARIEPIHNDGDLVEIIWQR